jgi:hypothetical protein
MKIQSIVHACLLGSLLVAAAGCVGEVRNSAWPERVAAGYPRVVDSGVVLPGTIGRHGIKDFYWLDNERIVFLAKEPDWVGPSGEKRDMFSLMLWTWRAGKAVRVRGPGIDGLCVGDDIVRYYRRRVESGNYDDLERYAGRFGEEKAVPMVLIDRETCRPQSELPPLPVWARERRIVRLRPEHGFVEWKQLSEGGYLAVTPVKMHRYGASEQQGLPITPALAEQTNLLFEYFRDAQGYFLTSGGRDASAARMPLRSGGGYVERSRVHYWWLSPTGSLKLAMTVLGWKVSYLETTIIFPPGDRITFPTIMGSITPFGQRFLAAGYGSGKGDRLDGEGLYLVDRTGAQQIAKGQTTRVSVSPDGCRAAFGLDDRDPKVQPTNYRLSVIDQCNGDKE